MEQLVEVLARILIAKGVEYAIAYAVAREQAAALDGTTGGSCSRCDALAGCRMRERSDLEDDCYAWDLPKRDRHHHH